MTGTDIQIRAKASPVHSNRHIPSIQTGMLLNRLSTLTARLTTHQTTWMRQTDKTKDKRAPNIQDRKEKRKQTDNSACISSIAHYYFRVSLPILLLLVPKRNDAFRFPFVPASGNDCRISNSPLSHRARAIRRASWPTTKKPQSNPTEPVKMAALNRPNRIRPLAFYRSLFIYLFHLA